MSLGKIATNIDAQQAYNSLTKVNKSLATTQLRMSTGKRINSTEDDPAGYQLARTLERRNRGLETALSNVSNAKNILAIAEGGFQSIMDILQTVKEKATQAADLSLSSTQRDSINDQVTALVAEIDDIVNETTFNGSNLIDGNYAGNFQTGENADNVLGVALENADSAALSVEVGSGADIDFSSAATANASITVVDAAIDTLAGNIQDIGEFQTRLTVKENTLSVSITNTDAVRSNVEDADMVREQMELLKLQIIQQTASVSFTQANTNPQLVLQLMQ
ncbi:MAG: flagellin [Candidatus Marinimicrobia bacterium]|nr:flagellin [Candidatus Neomarinimicrobiota bacterium]